jgi:hypothetical protein
MPKPKPKTSFSLPMAHKLLRTVLGSLKLVFFLVALSGVYIYTRAGVPTRVEAATSSTLNFQARLYNSSGTLVPDGNYHIEFKLHDNLSTSGGAQGTCSGSCLWRETRTTGNLVTVKNGYFSVNLGSVTSFPSLNWDQDMWLSMNIGGSGGAASWDGEMSPRIKLTAVPYAFRAGGLTSYNGTQSGNLTFSTVANSPNILLPDISGTNNVLLQSGTTLFTQGSIAFADASGRLTEDSANFFFDDTNNTLGLGTTRTGAISDTNARLVVKGSGATNATSSLNITNSSDVSMLLVRDDGNVGIGTTALDFSLDVRRSGEIATVSATTYDMSGTAGGTFVGRGANGTQAAPTASTQNDLLAFFGGRGYGATGFADGSRGAFIVQAAENWTDTAQGTYLSFETTPTGSTSRQSRMIVNANGNIGIGTTNSTAGRLIVQGATADNTAAALSIKNSTSSDLFYVRNDGNIGIGNASPAAMLSVGSSSQFQVGSGGAILAATGITSSGTITFSALNCTSHTNGGALTANENGIISCSDDNSGTLGSTDGDTLKIAYDNDADGSDSIISLTALDDSLIFRNPLVGGTDSAYILHLDQLATGAVDSLRVTNAGTGLSASLDNTNASGNGVLIDIQSNAAAQYALRVTTNNGASIPFEVKGDGTVALGLLNCTGNANGGALTTNASGIISCSDDDGGAGGSTTLQAAYTASTGGTTPEIKLDSTRASLDIQDADTTLAGDLLTVRGSNASGLGSILFGVTSSAINLNSDTILAVNKNLTFTAGTGSFDQSATSGTFKTGTGTVSLNGDTTIAANKNLVVASGTGTYSQTFSGTTQTPFSLNSTFVPSAGGTQINASLAVTNNPTVSANTLYGQSIAITESSNLASILTGQRIRFTDAGTGTGTKTGLDIDVTTANTNDTTYAAVFQGGNVGIGDASPAALLTVGSGDLFQVSSSGAVTSVGVNSGSGLIQGTGGLTAGGTVTLSALSTAGIVTNTAAGVLGTVTAVPIANGGTGQTTQQDAINALSGLTTNGDLLYHNGTNSTRLARGTDGQCLTSSTTTLIWGACGSTTLQGGYTASTGGTTPEIKLDTTRASLDIQDADTTLGATANLLAVRTSNAGNLGNVLFGVQGGGFVTLTPATSLTNGQIHLTQTLTVANATASGAVRANQLNLTVSNTTAGTTYGHDITVTDNSSSLGNTNTGLKVTMAGSNTSQSQYGIDVSVSQGIALRGITTGIAGNPLLCADLSNSAVGICGDSTATGSNSYGVYGRNTTSAGAGVGGVNTATGIAGGNYFGVGGRAKQSASAAYTATGVYGEARGGSGATIYGGYFIFDSSSTATLGSALYASNSTVGANILQLQDNTTDVLVVGDDGATTLGAVQPASGNGVNTLTVTGGKGANTATGGTGGNLSLTAGAGGNGSTANGNGGNITMQAGAPGTGAGTAGNYGSLLLNTAGGNVGIGISGTPSALLSVGGTTGNLTVNSSGNIATSGTLTLSALNCTTFANGGTLTTNSSGQVTCADDDGGAGGGSATLQGAYDASGTTDPQILLSSTNGGIKIRDGSTPVSGNLLQIQNNAGTAVYFGISASALTLQDSAGNNALVFDSTTSELKVYANAASPTKYARIYYDDGANEAVFAASTGTTKVGNGSGDVTMSLTAAADTFLYDHTFNAGASYNATDFYVSRNITGTSHAITGNVLSVEDLTTFTSGSSSPNILYLNQNNTSATGNLILAQAGGGANDKFKVSTTGTVTIASGQSYTGTGAVTVSAGASTALTLTSNAATTWSTSSGNLTIQAGGANSVILKPGTNSANAVQIQNAGGTSMMAFDSSANQIKVGVSDTVGTLFVLDTKTDAGDPAGTNGAMYYNSNANALRCYENGAWVDCVGGVTRIYSFIDTTTDAAVDANTTDYWDLAVENGNAHPNITPPNTNLKIYGIVTMEGQSTGTADVEITARVERNIGSVPTCGSGTAVGGKPGVFATNTNATKSSTVTFLDDPITTSTVYYTLCSDADTVGTIMNLTRIRFTFFLVKT